MSRSIEQFGEVLSPEGDVRHGGKLLATEHPADSTDAETTDVGVFGEELASVSATQLQTLIHGPREAVLDDGGAVSPFVRSHAFGGSRGRIDYAKGFRLREHFARLEFHFGHVGRHLASSI